MDARHELAAILRDGRPEGGLLRMRSEFFDTLEEWCISAGSQIEDANQLPRIAGYDCGG